MGFNSEFKGLIISRCRDSWTSCYGRLFARDQTCEIV